MTINEAIERLKKRVCCEKPVQHFCCDNCLHGIEECEISLAIEALENQVPKKLIYENHHPSCPNCKALVLGDYCGWCGQKIDWSEEEC